MMREADQDNKYNRVRVATSNQDLTKTREDEGRKKLQHKLGLEPAALYGTNRLASTKAN